MENRKASTKSKRKLKTVVSTSDNSDAFQCPDCLHFFRVIDLFTVRGFYTECPHCKNELVYYNE